MTQLITKLEENVAGSASTESKSISSIVADFEKFTCLLSSNHEHVPTPVLAPQSSHTCTAQNDILQALQHISTKLEQYGTNTPSTPNPSNDSYTHHAARQIAYWSSIFINMCHPSASQPTTAQSTQPYSQAFSQPSTSTAPAQSMQPYSQAFSLPSTSTTTAESMQP